MKTIDEIIGRAENLLCITDRCGLENRVCAGERYTRKERNRQRLVIYKWLQDNDYTRFMTETEKELFEQPVGNPFRRKVFHSKFFESEAIEPLLWTLGLTKKLSPYDRYAFTNWQENNEMHLKLKTNVPDTHQNVMETFGGQYREALDIILKSQKEEQDFAVAGKYVHQLHSTELQHLYKRTKWRYHVIKDEK